MSDDAWQAPYVLLAVDLVILTLRRSRLHVLVIERGVEPYRGAMALPGGFLRDTGEAIEAAARRELAEEAGLDADGLHLEQIGVYGDPGRDPRGRVVSVAYLAVAPALPEPVAGTDAAGARWVPADDVLSSRLPVAFDHQRIIADGVERARMKLEHSSLATAFCGEIFTVSDLQQVYEAVWGIRLDARNFYRKVQGTPGFIVPDGMARRAGTGRPARLFRAGPGTVLYPPMTRPSPTGIVLASRRNRQMDESCVVILTALGIEYDAVRALLADVTTEPHPAGTQFEAGRTRRLGYRVVLALTGKGNHPAAVLAERAIAQFEPAAVLFVGVAGARQERVALGDVVVATHVYAYHGGASQDDGTKARPRVWEASHGLDQLARRVDRAGSWTAMLDGGSGARPKVHFGPIAAGEVVHYSANSAQADWISDHYNDAMAVEMEAAGVAQAAHLNNALAAMVVRGISDRADRTKGDTDKAGWQRRAAANAAAFAVALAEEVAAARPARRAHAGAGAAPEIAASQHDRVARTSGGHQNIATGNARVGVQAGTIYGGVRIGPEPTLAGGDLTDLVADLRDSLLRAARAGLLDPPVHEAAEAELQQVSEALADGPEQNRSKLVVALRRLRGLIGDIADFGAKIATIIAAIPTLR